MEHDLLKIESLENVNERLRRLIREDKTSLFRKLVGVPMVQEWIPAISPEQGEKINLALALAHLSAQGTLFGSHVSQIESILSEINNATSDVVFEVSNRTHIRNNLHFSLGELSSLETALLKGQDWVFIVHEVILRALRSSGANIGQEFHRCYLSCVMSKFYLEERYANMLPDSDNWSPNLIRYYPEISLTGFTKEEKLDMLLESARHSIQNALSLSVNLGVPFIQSKIVKLVQHTEKLHA